MCPCQTQSRKPPESDVEHRVFQLVMDFHRSNSSSAAPSDTARVVRAPLKQIRHVPPRPLAQYIGVVSGRADADGLGGARVRVAQRLCDPLELVGGRFILWRLRPGLSGLAGAVAEDLVQHDDVVRGAAGALDHRVRLQVEIPDAFLGDAAVDDRTGLAVPTAVHVLGLAGVKARVVALADDDDGQPGQVLLSPLSRVLLRAGLAQARDLFVVDGLVLALRYTIAVYEDVLGQIRVLSYRGPVLKSFLEHRSKLGHHLLAGLTLDAEAAGPLTKVPVRRCHQTGDGRCMR